MAHVTPKTLNSLNSKWPELIVLKTYIYSSKSIHILLNGFVKVMLIRHFFINGPNVSR
jgi:hypothetical protein